MQQVKFGIGEVSAATYSLLRERAGLCAAVILAIAAGYTLLDLSGSAGGNGIASIAVSVFGQYMFTEQLLADRMPSPPPGRKYGALFIASLLSGLGVLLGAVLLVLPGIFLLARWLIASPFIVERGMGASEALKASWEATAKAWPGLFALILVAGAILIAAVIAIFVAAESWGYSDTSLVVLVPTNFLVGSMTVLAWLVAVAIYRLAVPAGDEFTEVFA